MMIDRVEVGMMNRVEGWRLGSDGLMKLRMFGGTGGRMMVWMEMLMILVMSEDGVSWNWDSTH